MITNSKQAWEVGESVNVGFLRGLMVTAIERFCEGAECDAYLLSKGRAEYRFVPHRGIERVD